MALPEQLPLVTVYIATHNRPELLARAVGSCVAQTYLRLEIIVVDDSSGPEHKQQNQQLLQQYPQIKYLHLAVASGAPVARNTAIEMANGEFITGLDDDDEFEPGRITELVQQWYSHPGCAFLSTGYTVINEQQRRFSFAKRARAISYQQLLYANLVGNQIFTLTSSLRAINGFDPAMPSCQDYDTWLRLSAVFGSGYRIGSCSYILHHDHQFERISASAKREQGYQLLLKKHGEFMSAAQLASHQVNSALHNNQPLPWRAVFQLPLTQQLRVLKNLIMRRAWSLIFFSKGSPQ
ncbi:Glycosyl transferase family 2 [Arsukibacterium tuosuense]|uniref:Glycosyl transferase family 2 n=1 Tax=Arsukibacterium tuosuense TaxID=1323745 RepID=A0A285IY61_9GAMM|nr:glycosyltransferase [Arsukibacterium tuosuense]SNY51841.1 Glycosyl transferase family 2 [Arsukibacterium tuosuense]